MRLRLLQLLPVLALAPGLGGVFAAASAPHPGAAIFEKLCAECHGDHGQGVDGEYDEPLTGEKSLEALAREIDRTMPEDDPDKTTAEDARLVAAYIYDAFYSPEAQARLNPPQKDLARLTIAQFRNSVMDVIGRFRMGPGFDRARRRRAWAEGDVSRRRPAQAGRNGRGHHAQARHQEEAHQTRSSVSSR